jgi:hypothetical protein
MALTAEDALKDLKAMTDKLQKDKSVAQDADKKAALEKMKSAVAKFAPIISARAKIIANQKALEQAIQSFNSGLKSAGDEAREAAKLSGAAAKKDTPARDFFNAHPRLIAMGNLEKIE